MEALDEEVRQQCYLESMTTMFKLGLICTSSSPSTRPSMKEVLRILQRCSPSEASGEKNVGPEVDVTPLLGSGTYLSSYRKSKKLSGADGYIAYSV